MSVRYRPSSISSTPEHVVSAKVKKCHMSGSCHHKLFRRGFHLCESHQVALECSPTACERITLGIMIDNTQTTDAGRHPTFLTLGFKMREPTQNIVVNSVHVYLCPHGSDTWPTTTVLELDDQQHLTKSCGSVSWISEDISGTDLPWPNHKLSLRFWCMLKAVVSLDIKR